MERCGKRIIAGEKATLCSLRVYDGGPLQPECLYLIRPDQLLYVDTAREDVAFVCPDVEETLDFTPRFGLITLREYVEPTALINKLIGIFERYNRWDESLRAGEASIAGIKQLFESSRPLLQGALVLGLGVLYLFHPRTNQAAAPLPQETTVPLPTEPPETETMAATQAATAAPLPPRLEIREETADGFNGCTVRTTTANIYVQAGNSRTQNRLAGSYLLRRITQSPNGYTMEELYLPSGTRFCTYTEADHGYLEYTEFYGNGQRSNHIIALNGTDAEVFTYAPDGTRTSSTRQADGPAYIAEKRKTLDDMLALLEEQLSAQKK